MRQSRTRWTAVPEMEDGNLSPTHHACAARHYSGGWYLSRCTRATRADVGGDARSRSRHVIRIESAIPCLSSPPAHNNINNTTRSPHPSFPNPRLSSAWSKLPDPEADAPTIEWSTGLLAFLLWRAFQRPVTARRIPATPSTGLNGMHE